MKEPTYSQVSAALKVFFPTAEAEDHTPAMRNLMTEALIAAQKVDQNIYGHLHYGFGCDGVTLMTDSKESRDRVVRWHHDSTSTLPYHEKYTIAELQELRKEIARLKAVTAG